MHPCWKAPWPFSRTRDSWLVKNFLLFLLPRLAYPPPRFGDYRPTIRHFSSTRKYVSLTWLYGCTLINKLAQPATPVSPKRGKWEILSLVKIKTPNDKRIFPVEDVSLMKISLVFSPLIRNKYRSIGEKATGASERQTPSNKRRV